ncbi:MAG: phage major capsid protein [bacterium]|nr:phage major capsid protein [bacterium]
MKNIQNSIKELGEEISQFKVRQEDRLTALETEQKEENALTQFMKRPALEKKISLISGGETQAHKQAFEDYLKKGDEQELISFERKSLSAGSDADGGYLVPTAMGGMIQTRLSDRSLMRQIANVMEISTEAIDLLLDRGTADAGWVAEVDEREETDTPGLAKLKIPVHEIYAKPRATQKLLEDSRINVESWISEKISQRMATLESQSFFYGDGENKPRGFLSYEQVTKEEWDWGQIECLKTGVNGGFEPGGAGGDILIDTVNALPSHHLKGACWIMARSAYARVRKLKDQNGHYLWQASLDAGDCPTLLGYPVYVCEEMPDLNPDEATTSIAFGNFHAGYQIVDRQDLRILRDPFSSKPHVEFYATCRVGGDVVNFEAIKTIRFEEIE